MANNRLESIVLERKRKREADKQSKQEDKLDKVDSKRGYRLEKIKAITAKAYAVASKRKWLVFLIGIALIAYFAMV